MREWGVHNFRGNYYLKLQRRQGCGILTNLINGSVKSANLTIARESHPRSRDVNVKASSSSSLPGAHAMVMASDGWIPEIVVGIDFGMTCTGMTALLKCKKVAAFYGLLKAGTEHRRCIFHGARLGRTKDPTALARENDQ